MIEPLRRRYNEDFTNEAYQAMRAWIGGQYNYDPTFHIAETPIFLPTAVRDRVFEACRDVLNVITAPDYAERVRRAIPPGEHVPNQTDRPLFLQLDFGLCKDERGRVLPQLIEVQGFPSLYFFQYLLDQAYRRFFPIPEGFFAKFGGVDEGEYLDLLRRVIIGNHAVEEVILLEVDPKGQNTRIDFIIAEKEIGVRELCISDVRREGRGLYYDRDGKRTRIRKIFNRVIFDELNLRPDLKREFNLIEDADVEWAGHPNWFFLVSKFSLPFMDSPYVPATDFLSELDTYPEDLENYVLKPLYSFAGAGVDLHPTPETLTALAKPENYILQRKVRYADLIATPDGPARAELRMMFVWPEDEDRPRLLNNLVRLSKGEMIGVKYNQGKTWVGGSLAYFEPDAQP